MFARSVVLTSPRRGCAVDDEAGVGVKTARQNIAIGGMKPAAAEVEAKVPGLQRVSPSAYAASRLQGDHVHTEP